MKKAFQLKAIAMFAMALFISVSAMAQGDKKPASPRETATGTINGANITIDYGSPSVKGRKVFGELEPYGKPWRAGANQTTAFTTDKDITVEGKKLPAGKYSLFFTPGETEWKVEFNSETGQWGVKKDASAPKGYSTNVDPSKDVVVATVKAKTAPMTEALKYVITAKGIELVWDKTSVPVSIK